jgi:DNA uptake protein ComE-like DNA-binding protein
MGTTADGKAVAKDKLAGKTTAVRAARITAGRTAATKEAAMIARRLVQRHRGSVLLLVLVVVAMLTLGTATYLELMQNERKAVRHHGRGVQAARLAESGVEYVKTLLALTPAEIQLAGGLAANPTTMQAVIVDDQGDEFDRGRFTILSPGQVDGLYAGMRYGLENESAKLNVNTLLAPGAEDQAASRLLAIPGMTPEIADAILDWIDGDEEPRAAGAEAEVYTQVVPPYGPRNAPIADLDELLLVRGVTPELLYGLDQNRNFSLDATERPRGLLAELDNTDGSLNRGWSAYLTVSSVEGMQPSAGETPVDLNGQNLQQLNTDLKSAVGDEMAKFIIAYRQYGAQQPAQTDGAQPAGGAGAAGQADAATGAVNTQNAQGTEEGAQSQNNALGNGAANQQQPVTVSASSLELNFQQEGGNQINSPLDLVGVTVQVPGEENAPPKNVESPWKDNAASYRDVMKLYDVISRGSAKRVAGRVNINAATRPVLRGIPGLPAAAVGKIVSRRELEPDLVLSDQRHAVWLLVENIVTLEEMKQLERYVTTRGDAFSGQAVGFFDAGPSAARGEFVVDRSGATPRLRAWRDLSPLGRGFTTAALGVDAADRP